MSQQPWGSYGTIHGCHISHGDQAQGQAMDVGQCTDWLWGPGMGTGHGDPLWGYPWGLAMGWGGAETPSLSVPLHPLGMPIRL